MRSRGLHRLAIGRWFLSAFIVPIETPGLTMYTCIDVEARRSAAMACGPAVRNARTWASSAKRATSSAGERFLEDTRSLWKKECGF